MRLPDARPLCRLPWRAGVAFLLPGALGKSMGDPSLCLHHLLCFPFQVPVSDSLLLIMPESGSQSPHTGSWRTPFPKRHTEVNARTVDLAQGALRVKEELLYILSCQNGLINYSFQKI